MQGAPPAAQRLSLVAGPQPVSTVIEAAGLGRGPDVTDRLIAAGRVAVNGQTTRSAQWRVDPLRDLVTVDGQPVTLQRVCRYIILHKPYRVMCSFTDREGHSTLGDYVPLADVYAAGRLDYESEGLLLLSDDGWLLHQITHPRFEHPKTYLVQVERIPESAALDALRRGVVVHGEKTRPAEVELLAGDAEPQAAPRSVPIRYCESVPTAWLRVVLHEGHKRQLRHMTAAVGHPTLRLIRTAIGPIALGELAAGRWRPLTEAELHALATSLRRRSFT